MLAQQLSEYIQACFTGIWIESHEHEDALAEIGRLCREEDWRLAVWNISAGLRFPGGTAEDESTTPDPLAAIRAINSLASPEGTAILVLQNFHRFLQSAEIVQALLQQIVAGKQNRTFIVILSPVVQIPTELEKLLAVIEHELPGREQLAEIARGIATEEGELPSEAEMSAVLDAAAGLTRYETEGAFSLALVRHGALRPREIWELKSQVLKKSGLLSHNRPVSLRPPKLTSFWCNRPGLKRPQFNIGAPCLANYRDSLAFNVHVLSFRPAPDYTSHSEFSSPLGMNAALGRWGSM